MKLCGTRYPVDKKLRSVDDTESLRLMYMIGEKDFSLVRNESRIIALRRSPRPEVGAKLYGHLIVELYIQANEMDADLMRGGV